MKTAKRIISLILMAVIAFSMSACASGSSDNGETAGNETGAWAMNDQKNEAKLPDEVEKAFRKATENFTGGTLEPVAYIGSQVVAGMNYMIICREVTATQEPESSYKIAVIYADLEGNAELTSLSDFDFTKYTEGEGTKNSETLSGGWYASPDAAGSEIPDDVRNVYEKATEAVCWEWAEVDLLAYLGSQVVAGTNYAILCHGKLTEDESTDHIFIITVYEDPDGSAGVSNIHTLDLSEL